MTEKHKWISDNLSLIEETTGIKLYGTVCTDITFIAKQLNDANETILRLEKENEQLKKRNQRQAKRLTELYELMAKKDWESLTEIIDDFCSCEEQLQREWRTYE